MNVVCHQSLVGFLSYVTRSQKRSYATGSKFFEIWAWIECSDMGTLHGSAIFRGSPTISEREKTFWGGGGGGGGGFFCSPSKMFISKAIWILEALAVNQLFALPCSKLIVARVCCRSCVTVCIANFFRYHSRHMQWNMSSVAKVVNRVDVFEDIGIQNKWEWFSKLVKVGETDQRIGTHFHKIALNSKMPCLFQRCTYHQLSLN